MVTLGMLTTRLSLIQRLRDRSDRQSWDEFARLYRPLFFRYARKTLGSLRENEVDDVVQEIFVGLLRKLPEFELDHSRGRFRTFLWKMTNNAAIDWLRKRQRTAKMEGQCDEELGSLEQAAASEPDEDWSRELRQRVFAFAVEQVRELVQPKNPQKWSCFAEHILKGQKAEAVATTLAISPNLVYVNASRVLAQVREKCGDYHEELKRD